MIKAGLACAALFLLACASLQSAALEEIFEKNYPVPPDVKLTIRNTDGAIYVYGSSDPELRIYARKKAYSKERLAGISINVSTDGDTAAIDTVYPPTPQGLSVADRSGTVDYVILVPEKCSLERVELSNGELILEGMRGARAHASLTNGRMTARDCFTDLQLAVSNGGLDIFYNWWEETRFGLQAEIINGHILALLPKETALRLEAESPNGNINHRFPMAEAPAQPHNLTTNIGAGSETAFKLRALNGNIEIIKGD